MANRVETVGKYRSIHDLTWSSAEKAVARKVFDAALQGELTSLIRDIKQMAARIREPLQLWEMEEYLTERRKEIDRKYDYRYSVLLMVFGRLVGEGRISADELKGLSAEKMEYIHAFAKLVS